MQSGMLENPGSFVLGLHQDPRRNARVVIDRNNHLWIFTDVGLSPERERKRQQERT